MNPDDPNAENLEAVVSKLGEIADSLVLVGGCAVGLLTTVPLRPPRVTNDVDFIVNAGQQGFADLEERLRQKGFRNDPNIRVRFHHETQMIDVVPTPSHDGNNHNRWYNEVVGHAQVHHLRSGQRVRCISAPLFIACKLEAFYGRGENRYGESHDLEDIVTVINGRPTLVFEIREASAELQSYLEEEFEDLLGQPGFVEAMSSQLPGDRQSQNRHGYIISTMQQIARLRE